MGKINTKNAAVIGGITLFVIAAFLFLNSPANNAPETASLSDNMTTQSQPKEKGFTFQDVTIGKGKEAQNGDMLTVHYVGTLANGTVFDSSRNRNFPFQFTLGANEVIPCWDQGFTGMKVGGVRKLTCYPESAYGDRGVGNVIPQNATLNFEVELLQTETSESEKQ